jgi:translocation and assembly module TamB
MEEKKLTTKRKSLAGKVLRIVYKTFLILTLVIATIALLILTPPVQDFARKKVTAWLTNKLKTKVEIGKIYLGFPKKVVLENVYIEDRKQDTLLSGGALKVDISMFKLLKSQVEINQVQLSNITAKVKRVLPDTAYNFQFIIDAFAPADTAKSKPADTAAVNFSVKDVELEKIRVVYDDAVTGSDMTLWLDHFDTEMDDFDLNKMRFSIPSTNIKGIRANVYQKKPLVEPAEITTDTAATAPPPDVDIDFGEFILSDIKVDYGNDVSAFYTNVALGQLILNADDIDMRRQVINLDKLQLDNTTAAIRLGKKEKAKLVTEEAKQETKQQAESGWRILIKNINLNNNNLAFENDNEPEQKQGMDYAHFDAKRVTLHANDFIFNPDSIGGKISKGELSEKSGFQLNTLETDFLYSGKQAYLYNLLIETPGTVLKRSVEIKYPSVESLGKDIGKMQINVDLDNSHVQVKDILTFAPMLRSQRAFANHSETWQMNGRITGSVADLNIQTLQLRALSNTVIDVRGKISGLPDAKKVGGNLAINSIQTNRSDINMLAPKGAIPSNITLPESIILNGNVSGSMQHGKADLNLTTDLGSASVNGTIKNATDTINAQYHATLVAKNLDLGTIMQNDSMYGPVSATIVAKGKGFTSKAANADINAVINSAVLNSYTYKDATLTAQLARQRATFAFNISDPNITIDLKGRGDISREFPAIAINATIDSINTKPLNFTPATLMYKGTIIADFKNTDPANPDGQLLLTKSVLATKDQRYPIDSISITSGKSDSGKFVRLRSDVVSAELTGEYNLAQLGSAFQQSIQPYYAILPDTAKKDTIGEYDFRLKANVVNGSLIKIFLPTLDKLEPITLLGHFTSNNGWNTSLDAPLIIIGANRIQKIKLNAGTSGNAIKLTTGIEQFSSGATMNIYATTLVANVADNKINFLVNLKDIENKNKYRFGGLFEQQETNNYTLKLYPDSLLLNYDKWNIANDNIVRLNNGDVNISNFALSNGNQQLSLNSQAQTENSPMDIKLKDFRINTLTAFAKQDTALVDGVINGEAVMKNIAKQPAFTSDITVTNLMFRTDTVGNLHLKVNNTTENVYAADITLTGSGNDVNINGNYNVKSGNESAIDLKMNIRKLQMTSVQSFSMGAISNASGSLNGNFDISGTFDKPNVNGALNFNHTRLSPTMLGSHFIIDKEQIKFDNTGIHFDSFTILDTTKNQLNLDGDMLTSNFVNYKLDLDLTAKNFEALNSTKQNNKLFYGQFYFDTDLHITGTEKSPDVNGSLSVNEKTKFTVVLPQSEPGVEDREGVVRFIDMDSVKMDTTIIVAQADSLNQTSLTGMNVSVNIEINKNAELTLIIDEGNGDFIRMKGTGQLTGGIDPSGKTTLTGNYEIDEGAYQLSVNFLQRKFEIQKGSKITWLGEPTHADVNITALYIAKTAPLTLVEDQLQVSNANPNLYKQKLPFNVKLNLTGELMKPNIAFDIVLPEESDLKVDATVTENVQTRLTQLKSEPSELNKQVFALLLLNRFVSENPFATSGGGGGVGSMARQSVSKLLTEQLNNLAADLISGVELNFDVASTEDYTTGQMQNRTDLNVSLSKQLLSDRLKVTVGSNFELEGPQQTNQRQNNLAGNVALDYMLSKDGRYLLRAYRKNEYEGELEGYIIETGVNFILSFDYDHFHDLFRKKAKK